MKTEETCPGSSSQLPPPDKRTVTGLIPGGGIQNLLLLVTVSTPKLANEMLQALKGKTTYGLQTTSENKKKCCKIIIILN